MILCPSFWRGDDCNQCSQFDRYGRFDVAILAFNFPFSSRQTVMGNENLCIEGSAVIFGLI